MMLWQSNGYLEGIRKVGIKGEGKERGKNTY